MEAEGKGGKAARRRKAKKERKAKEERSTGHNPEECPVCMTVFDGTVQRPRTLPCGHTVCTLCVNKLKQENRVTCPECRVGHAVPEGGQFPINYTVEAFIRRVEGAEAVAAASPSPSPGTGNGAAAAAGQKEAAGLSRKMQSFLQEQEASVLTAITTCQEVQAQLDQYQTTLRGWGEQQQQLENRLQGLLDQSRSARELVQQEESRAAAKKEEAREGEQQLHAALEALRTPAAKQEARVAVAEVLRCTFEAKEGSEECRKSFPDANTATTVRKVSDASNAALEAFQAALEAHPSVLEELVLQSEADSTIEDRLEAILTPDLKASFDTRAGTTKMRLWASLIRDYCRRLYSWATMDVQHVMLLLLVASLLVAVAVAAASGCISRTALITSTFQDEMNMWLCRRNRDVEGTVDLSEGSCVLRIEDRWNDEWLHVTLGLKDDSKPGAVLIKTPRSAFNFYQYS